MLKVHLIGIGIIAAGFACFGIVHLTHSGLGSCGFYGPASFLLIPGMLTFPVGGLVIAGYWVHRGMNRWRERNG
jgi:purine-cytosine permease-like protein